MKIRELDKAEQLQIDGGTRYQEVHDGSGMIGSHGSHSHTDSHDGSPQPGTMGSEDPQTSAETARAVSGTGDYQ